MTGPRFRKFVMEHRDAINDMIVQQFPSIDEHLDERLRRGFDRCLEPCFEALVVKKGDSIPLSKQHDDLLLAIMKLLVLAIRKRYYAFPAKEVVAVDHDLFFDRVIPRAITSGLLDSSNEPLVVLFNAGEHLQALSTPFYTMVDALVDAIGTRTVDLHAIIHVVAWLAGDARRRRHALSLLSGSKIPPDILPLAVFGNQIPTSSLLGKPIAMELHAMLLMSLASDPWLTPPAMVGDPGFAALIEAANAGKPSLPPAIKATLSTRASSKTISTASSLKFLGKAGKFDGFGGMLDAPPVVVGSTSETSLIAVTGAGRILQVDYGGISTRMHVLGTTNCRCLANTRDRGLVALDASQQLRFLSTGQSPGTIPLSSTRPIATGAAGAAFFCDAGGQTIYKVADNDDFVDCTRIDVNMPIEAMAAIDDDRLAVVAKQMNPEEWMLHVVSTSGETTKFMALPSRALVGATGTTIACLIQDGSVLIMNLDGSVKHQLETRIDPASTTSFHLTNREIITTHAFTHAIHFHGPPV